jgi:hypothetical protein
LIETEYKKFVVFDYRKTLNKSFYYPDTNNGKNPWFYEPSNYKGEKPHSLGYKTKNECLLDAHIDECDILIKIYEKKLKIITSFFDTLTELEATKCIGKTLEKDVAKLEMSYSSSMYLMKRLQLELKDLRERRIQLKKLEENQD